jgi:hypothetical protein
VFQVVFVSPLFYFLQVFFLLPANLFIKHHIGDYSGEEFVR